MKDDTRAPRCGLIGPGRTRNGLGPFLVRDLEVAGARVVAVAGRDPDRTRAAAADLADVHGHEVAAVGSVEALLEHDLDAVVVASPIRSHLPALRAAAATDVAVLAEKPLVAPEEHDEVPALLAAFEGRLIKENCPWPYALHALPALWPELRGAPVEHVEMLMSPSGRGRHMVVDSVSHFISVLQHLVAIDDSTRVVRLELRGHGPATEAVEIDLVLESPFPRLRSTLYLARHRTQPRPAWVAVNGKRVEREIRSSDYSISFVAEDRTLEVEDPMTALVSDFVQLLREPDLDRIRAESTAIRERGRLYRQVVDAWAR